MRHDAADKTLTRVLHSALGMTREHEDALWSRFAAQRASELAGWAAFAAGMVLLNARLRPAIRSAYWTAPHSPGS